MAPTADAALQARILEFVRDAGSGDFGELALALFARQFRSLAAYRAHCEAQGLTPETVGSWSEIPAVADGSVPPEPVEREPEDRGSSEPPLARAVLRRAAPELCDPRRLHLMVGADAEASPGLDSKARAEPGAGSVNEVFRALRPEAPANSMVGFGRLDAKALRSWLGARQRDRGPVAVITDASGFARLTDVLERRAVKFRLPPGSEAFLVGSFESAAAEAAGSWKQPLLELLGLAPEACRRLLAGPRGSTPLVEPPPILPDQARLPHWVRVTGVTGGRLAILDLASLDAPARRLEPAAAAPWLARSS